MCRDSYLLPATPHVIVVFPNFPQICFCPRLQCMLRHPTGVAVSTTWRSFFPCSEYKKIVLSSSTQRYGKRTLHALLARFFLTLLSKDFVDHHIYNNGVAKAPGAQTRMYVINVPKSGRHECFWGLLSVCVLGR